MMASIQEFMTWMDGDRTGPPPKGWTPAFARRLLDHLEQEAKGADRERAAILRWLDAAPSTMTPADIALHIRAGSHRQ